MIKTIAELAWSWFKSNIKLPFNQEKLKEQAVEIAYNQGLSALVTSLEKMVPDQYRQNLSHPMWLAVKESAQSNDPAGFVQQASIAMKNSGQADSIMKAISNAGGDTSQY